MGRAQGLLDLAAKPRKCSVRRGLVETVLGRRNADKRGQIRGPPPGWGHPRLRVEQAAQRVSPTAYDKGCPSESRPNPFRSAP